MNFEKIKKVKNSKPVTVLDAVFAAVLAVAIGLSFFFVYRRPAETVTVTVYGKTVYSGSIAVDKDLELEHITVHIRGKKIWVTDADCPDRTCVKTGVISRAGQSIVCLPNATVVAVSAKSDLQWETGGR